MISKTWNGKKHRLVYKLDDHDESCSKKLVKSIIQIQHVMNPGPEKGPKRKRKYLLHNLEHFLSENYSLEKEKKKSWFF